MVALSAFRWLGRGDCRRQHLASGDDTRSSVTAKASIGRMLTKTSAPKACSTVSQRTGRHCRQNAHRSIRASWLTATGAVGATGTVGAAAQLQAFGRLCVSRAHASPAVCSAVSRHRSEDVEAHPRRTPATDTAYGPESRPSLGRPQPVHPGGSPLLPPGPPTVAEPPRFLR